MTLDFDALDVLVAVRQRRPLPRLHFPKAAGQQSAIEGGYTAARLVHHGASAIPMSSISASSARAAERGVVIFQKLGSGGPTGMKVGTGSSLFLRKNLESGLIRGAIRKGN